MRLPTVRESPRRTRRLEPLARSPAALAVLSFYGGGFATVPAYLKDLFGTYEVGAIHGRLLTARSTAGVLGPLIVHWIADRQESAGRHGSALYGLSFRIMTGLLVVGFVANELVRPVSARHHIPAPREAADAARQQPESRPTRPAPGPARAAGPPSR